MVHCLLLYGLTLFAYCLACCCAALCCPAEFQALTQLTLEGCSSLLSLPDSLGNLQVLKVLKRLALEGCSSLVLPESISRLRDAGCQITGP